jgi:heptosyltransferase I
MRRENRQRRPRILIVRLGSLGDIVHTIPAQQRLAARYPSAEIHWVAEGVYSDFLGRVPGVHRIWTADTRLWRRGSTLAPVGRLLKLLRAENFDLALDFQGLLKSAVLARLSGARRVRGFGRGAARERPASWFYTERVDLEYGRRHQVEHHLMLLEPHERGDEPEARFPLDLPVPCVNNVRRRLEERRLVRPILLNPGGGWSTKRWSIERFARLADRIQGELNRDTVFTFGPGEEALIEEARLRVRSAPLHAFPTDILELAALCRLSSLMVSGDTGPLHLAVSQGTPTVALLGPAHPWRTGPFRPEDAVVRHELPCPHPYRRTCRDHFCMDITVESVFSAVLRRLETAERPSPSSPVKPAKLEE